MPRPMYRSGSFRKVKRVTPKGRTVTHYVRRSSKKPHCAICGTELNGISEEGGKSRRTNSRIFGGVLCAKCASRIIVEKSRIEQGGMKLDDISIKDKSYVLQLLAH
ncbi:MAG: 50S ribosomal protein L34e [Candidatus Micrarchaeia archaeon]